MQIHTIGEYWELCERLNKDELEELKNSIIENGYLEGYPIIVNDQGVVLDGHHRFKICKELGIIPSYKIQKFDHPLLEERFVITCNFKRKDLCEYRRIRAALRGKPNLQKLAKENMSTGGARHVTPLKPIGRVDDQIAKDAKSSRQKVWKVDVIHEVYPQSDPVIEKLEKEDLSINYAHQMATRSKDHKNPPKLPKGEFDVFYVDPPWTYEFTARGTAQDHYATMPLEDICNLDLPAADNAILFMWSTMSKLDESLLVMNQWGFTYRTHAVWVKDKIGNGYYFRGQHELLLIGKKGKGIGIPEEKNRPSSVIIAPRREHSEKPEKVYGLIESMYPNRQYIELFARNKREGWTSWGDEV